MKLLPPIRSPRPRRRFPGMAWAMLCRGEKISSKSIDGNAKSSRNFLALLKAIQPKPLTHARRMKRRRRPLLLLRFPYSLANHRKRTPLQRQSQKSPRRRQAQPSLQRRSLPLSRMRQRLRKPPARRKSRRLKSRCRRPMRPGRRKRPSPRQVRKMRSRLLRPQPLRRLWLAFGKEKLLMKEPRPILPGTRPQPHPETHP